MRPARPSPISNEENETVNKLMTFAALILMILAMAAPVLAAEADPAAAPGAAAPAGNNFWKLLGASFGSGLIIIGAGFGIGWIGSSAVASMARQPEVAGRINTAMIIAAALVEGVTFFALIVCLLTIFLG
jgi:F-type H+-transporting ATPase subunit c